MLFMLRFLPFLEELVRRAARGIVQAHFTFGTKGAVSAGRGMSTPVTVARA